MHWKAWMALVLAAYLVLVWALHDQLENWFPRIRTWQLALPLAWSVVWMAFATRDGYRARRRKPAPSAQRRSPYAGPTPPTVNETPTDDQWPRKRS